MKEYKLLLLITVLTIVLLLLATMSSYSLFTYTKKGNTSNIITTGIYTSPIEMDLRTYSVDNRVYVDVHAYSKTTTVDYATDGNTKQYLPNDIKEKSIYVIPFYSSDWYIDELDYKSIFSEYKNVTIGNKNVTVEELTNNNYDIVIINYPFWDVPDIANNFFKSGINLLTIGDDSNKTLDIIKESTREYKNVNGIINAIADNIITRKLNFKDLNTYTGRSQIKFIDDTEIWYRENLDGNIYDTIGYYNNKNTRWIHAQYYFDTFKDFSKLESFVKESVDFISKKDIATFEITTSGDYTYTVFDKAGNKQTKTIYIDTTPPTKPTFSNKTVTDSNVTLDVNTEEKESGIKNITCYYGDSQNNITNVGTLNNTTCVYPSTASYAKVCVKNNFGLESCSDPKQLAIYLIKDGIMLEEFKTNSTNATYTNEDGYIALNVKSTSRTGLYTANNYITSNWGYSYIDISWIMTASDTNSNPSIEFNWNEDGSWLDKTGTTWNQLYICKKTAGNYELNITTEQTLYTKSIGTNTKQNTTLTLGKNATSPSANIEFDINIYNIWIQLKE